jgi:hypothetical protein
LRQGDEQPRPEIRRQFQNEGVIRICAFIFLKGAYIVYAHSVLQRQCGLGYTSDWAKRNFTNIKEENNFFRTFGETLNPAVEDSFAGFNESSKPKTILDTAAKSF